MKKILFAVFIILLIPLSSYANEKIVIAADNWCPFNCEPGSEKPGYMVEIAKKVFSEKGYEIEYKIIPWARALMSCRKGEINGVIGPYKADAPDFIYPENEQGMIGFSAFTTKGIDWKYKGINSVKHVSLAVIRDYAYSDEINAYIDKNYEKINKVQLMSGDAPLEKNIKKILAGRVDATIETGPVFWYTASEMGVKDKFRNAGIVVEPEKAYIAFSPKLPTSDKYAKILSTGIEKLRKSGELNKILSRYGLSDWR